MYTVSMEKFVKEFELEVIIPEIDFSDKLLTSADVNRPALQISGFFEHFDSDRVQVIGMVEHTYLKKLDAEFRRNVLKQIFSFKIPCLVISRNLEVFPDIIELAKEYEVPVFRTKDNTSEFMAECIRWLNVELAPRLTMHGVLVDIYGEGILITGDSGIGKSETALELIKRGHRLVADDAVEIKRVSHRTLVGTSPELIRYFIELRGIGILDVKQLYGAASVKQTQNIDLVVKLEMWDEDKEYDRLGLTEEYIDILGNKVLCNSIPIRPGRNVAIICEAAAINHRQKKMGYNAAQVLHDRIAKSIAESSED
ncbi:MAG: HPr kinase/phosphorylase [Tyzzerella sp.]|uniref:HPr kinase/phosphorylase n=1 Tax=Candidatus Fimicola merdigallinarum TaxID=2840819 RepID=A0A9D9DX55_9FIRM|nr:HPr kinase/phosphorylase [Candidatus Fimicola merdigallinarum]